MNQERKFEAIVTALRHAIRDHEWCNCTNTEGTCYACGQDVPPGCRCGGEEAYSQAVEALEAIK